MPASWLVPAVVVTVCRLLTRTDRGCGRHMLLAGRKGHVAIVDVLRQSVLSEAYYNETVRDATFLHNVSLHAVAQKKYVYIYDAKGTEVHCMKSHIQPQALEFLPYHFLLVSVGNAGYLKYQVRRPQATCRGQSCCIRRGNCTQSAANVENATIQCCVDG